MMNTLVALASLLFIFNTYAKDRSVSSTKIDFKSCLSSLRYISKDQRPYTYGKIHRESILSFEHNLHVTQFLYGKPSIVNRIENVKGMDFEEIQELLDEKVLPYVLGPDGKFYIIDSHHFSLALVELRKYFKYRFGQRAQDLKVKYQQVDIKNINSSKLGQDEFIEMMTQLNLTYLKVKGQNRRFESLPKRLVDLEEDFYRGLSWLVRKSGAYKKTDVPFAEFFWADYLLKKLGLEKEVFSEAVILKGIRASIEYNDLTKKLPGYKGKIDQNEEEVEKRVKKAFEKLKTKGLLDLDLD